MSNPTETEAAKNAAMRASLAAGRNSRGMAAELMRAAEIKILREQVSAQLAGGERQYWELVEQELRK